MLKDRQESSLHPRSTKRLRFREAEISDSAFVLQLLTEPSWKKYIGKHEITSESHASDYLVNRFIPAYKEGLGFWIVEQTQNGAPVGICGLTRRSYLDAVDLGFALLEKYWGSGFGVEASLSVIDYAEQQLKINYLLAITVPENHASLALLERLGFQYKTRIRNPDDELLSVFER